MPGMSEEYLYEWLPGDSLVFRVLGAVSRLDSPGDTATASSEVRNSHAREVQMDATAKRNQLDIVDDVERGLSQI